MCLYTIPIDYKYISSVYVYIQTTQNVLDTHPLATELIILIYNWCKYDMQDIACILVLHKGELAWVGPEYTRHLYTPLPVSFVVGLTQARLGSFTKLHVCVLAM